jgi:long-chain acyl-CoA synthetase
MLETGPHVPVSFVARDVLTLGDMFRRRVRLSGRRPAIYEKRDGRWQPLSWQEFYDGARRVAAGLLRLGLAHGDRVAILGPTRSPWGRFDMGAQLAGMVSLGIYPKQAPDQIRYILEHSDARVVFVDEESELDAVLTAAKGLPKIVAIVPWTKELYEARRERDERLMALDDVEREELDEDRIDAVQHAIAPEDLAILIYTSGTTGPPKGAMITHRNILSLLAEQDGLLELFEDDLSLNFLPMAHAAERVLGFYGRINSGIATAYASHVGAVLEEVKEVKPTLFGSVPRIFEKAYGRIHSEAEKKPPIVQKIFRRAAVVAREISQYRVRYEKPPLPLMLQHRVFDRIVYRKVRDAFGGRVRQFVTGAAPIAVEILEFFWGAGLDIFEAYGMTESTVITHANRTGQVKLGTVGKPIGGCEHRIASDGEVLIRAPFVFKGYFKNEQATSETVIDGWLHTGDIGSIDSEDYLRITDRKKHLIITAGGKNLAPANIENAIKNQSPLISQVHAHGDRRPYVTALVAPSPVETLELGQKLGLVTSQELQQRTSELLNNPSSRSEALERAMQPVVKHPEYREKVRAAVKAGNRELAQVEKVRRFVILDRDFSQEHGEMTPSLKLKRKEVETKFADVIERIYTEEGFALEP